MMLLLNFWMCAVEQKIDICRDISVHRIISVCVQIYTCRLYKQINKFNVFQWPMGQTFPQTLLINHMQSQGDRNIMLREDDDGMCFEITTSIPVSFLTSGTELVISHRLRKVTSGQAKPLSRELLRKPLVFWELELATVWVTLFPLS